MEKLKLSCMNSCSPIQIINLNTAINDISKIEFYDNCDVKYDKTSFHYSYSVDNVCWSCYMLYDDILKNTMNLNTDFYIRIKMSGLINYFTYDSPEHCHNFTSQLAQGFNFEFQQHVKNDNMFNPYANLDCAIALQQQLSETVSNLFGIPVYYFKLNPDVNSKDITFKEYALMNVESVKQIKMIIADGQMPSSKPVFDDFGLDFETDWETEISKTTFATAFGPKAQPMEGDLIYIPMMKRMWMVNEAYDEKKDAMMWCSTTFNLALTKYQEKDSVDLGDTEDMVNSFVKNKYEDLFGDEEPVDSGFESDNAPLYAANNLYPVFESDSTRKYVTCDSIEIQPNNLYYKGSLISEYRYNMHAFNQANIIYQRQYCGTEISCSFIICPGISGYEGKLLSIGNKILMIKQTDKLCTLFLNIQKELKIDLIPNKIYFVTLRWCEALNNADLSAYVYTWKQNIPQYKLQNHHYYFDIDNPSAQKIVSYNIEFETSKKSEVILYNFEGWITNIKIFDLYNDNISELLQLYPTHQHLIINDTSRKLIDSNGIALP